MGLDRRRAFTLIELMIVVVILGVLAVIAVKGFGILRKRALRSEVPTILGEIRIKEEAYRAAMGTYLSTDTGSSEQNICPRLIPGSEPLAKDPTILADQPSCQPLTATGGTWNTLQIRLPKKEIYCGYVVVAGSAGATLTAGTAGAVLLGTTAQTDAWFYARACCDFDGDATVGTCPAYTGTGSDCDVGQTHSVFEITSSNAQTGTKCEDE